MSVRLEALRVAGTQVGVRETSRNSGPEVDAKRCPRCKTFKPREAFGTHRRKPDGLRAHCKGCERTSAEKYRLEHGDAIRRREAIHRKRRGTARATEVSRRSRFKRLGVTPEFIDALTAAQGGACRSCGCLPVGAGSAGRLQVDHDHSTGRFRGLLCTGCNVALGMLRDDVTRIEALARYAREALK